MEAALTPGRRLAAAVPSAGAEIALQNPNGYREVNVRGLRPWLAALVASLAPQAESFAVRFVGDRAMRRLNRDFRGKDATTDVLSFPGGTTMEGRHLGDVVISLPAARRQTPAAEPVEREVRRLLLHGVLHCLGYDHETDDGEMESVEASLRRQWIGVDHVL